MKNRSFCCSSNRKECRTYRVKGKDGKLYFLKALMQLDEIGALCSPEEYVKYGVTIPNGILLYGTPLGEIFFAKHFECPKKFEYFEVHD